MIPTSSASTASRLRVLIADDERLMREQLRTLILQIDPEVEIVAEAHDGQEAVEVFKNRQPDVVFLDIRMPRIDGIEAARHITSTRSQPPCEIVFVTAYDHHAIEAFERGAIDYLLKPATLERLQRTLERIRTRIAHARAEPRLPETGHATPIQTLLEQLQNLLQRPSRAPHLSYIQASIGTAIELIPVENVLFFTADEKYTRLRTTRTEALLRKSIRELLEELDPDLFWQVHRSSIVNLRAISKVHRDSEGRLHVAFHGIPERIEVSRSFAQRFKSM